jgi:methionyl-tRNA formyltransferase
MRLVFLGTPDFAAVALRALIAARHEIAAVYAQPPRPAGRGYAEKKSAVHMLAERHGLPVRTPASLKSNRDQEEFRALHAEVAIVAAYGLLLPGAVLAAPKHGCFNIHASLLPRWRGAAPIQRAIMAGDKETGVTIMKMDAGLDTGPMCRVERMAIAPDMTAGTLHDALAAMGARLMAETLDGFPPHCVAQPAEGVTYAKKIDKAETRIVFSKDATTVRNQIHGLSPFPGAWCMIDDVRVRILRCEAVENSGTPGLVIDDRLTVACGTGAVRFLEIQREGKSAMSADVFLRGFPVKAGIAVG